MSSHLRLRAAILAGTLLLTCGVDMGLAAPKDGTGQVLTKDGTINEKKQQKKVTQKQRDTAAALALQQGALNPLMVTAEAAVGIAAVEAPTLLTAPRYFSHPNYANSPLPEVTVTPGSETPGGNPLIDRTYATDCCR